MLLEETEDVVGRVECDLAGKSIGQDSNQNRDRSGNNCPIRGDLGVVVVVFVIVVVVVVILVIVLVIFIVLVLLDALVLLNPTKTNKIDGRMLDVSLVKQFNNLGTNQSTDCSTSKRSQTLERIVAHRLSLLSSWCS